MDTQRSVAGVPEEIGTDLWVRSQTTIQAGEAGPLAEDQMVDIGNIADRMPWTMHVLARHKACSWQAG